MVVDDQDPRHDAWAPPEGPRFWTPAGGEPRITARASARSRAAPRPSTRSAATRPRSARETAPIAARLPAEHAAQLHGDGRLELRVRAGPRIAVGPPPHEPCGVAEPVPLEVLVRDLGDQLGTQRLPRQVLRRVPAARRAGHAGRGRVGAAPVAPRMVSQRVHAVGGQLVDELAAERRREAAGHPDVVEHPVVVVEAEEQRADPAAVLVGAVAGDDAVGGPLVLDLHHGPLPGAVRVVEALADDPVEPGPFELGEPSPGDSPVGRGGSDVDRLGVGDQPLKQRPPGRERLVADVVVAVGEEVEADEAHRRLRGEGRDAARRGVDPQGEQVEVEPVGGGDDELAVDDHPGRQRGPQRVEDLGEVPVEGTLVAARQLDLVAVAEHETAEPVPLGLVRPAVAGGELAGEAGEHRLDGGQDGEPHLRTLPRAAPPRGAGGRSRAEGRRDVVEGQLVVDAGGPHPPLDDAPREALGAEGEPNREADQVGVGELDPRAGVPVVVEHLDTGLHQPVVELLGGGADRVATLAPAGEGDEVHRVRGEGGRPDQPAVVVVLLGHRGDDARHADPVAAHDHGVLVPGVVLVAGVERLAVLGADLEDVADLDAPVDRERRPAAGARIAGRDADQLHPPVDGHVPPDDRVAHMTVGLVGAGDPAVIGVDRRVGDDDVERRVVRAEVAAGQLGVGGEVVVVEEPHPVGGEGAGEGELVDVPVAGDERGAEPRSVVAVDRDDEALQQHRLGDVEQLRDGGDAGPVRRVDGGHRRRVDGAVVPVGGAAAGRFDVGGVVAARAPDEVVLPHRGDGHELLAGVAAHLPRLGLDRPPGQAAAGEDPTVRAGELLVGPLQVGRVGVERVGVLHQELPASQEAEPGA